MSVLPEQSRWTSRQDTASAPATHPHAIAYRPDIDGLRAVAVLAVIGFHAFPIWLRGGFVGVDIFFVISGFLISGIILRQVQEGRFSYLDFYGRRIRRLFPALLLVLLACLVFGYRELFISDFARLSLHSISAAAFVANIQFWREASYFDVASEFKPLLHLWSLGVEEQYYIVWPIVVSLLLPKTRWFLTIIAMIFVSSFALNLALTRWEPTAAFYLPLTRFWELMLGSALAFAVMGKVRMADSLDGVLHTPIVRDLASVAGLLLIAVSVLFISASQPFPGWIALLPTIGTVLLILAGPNGFVNRRLLQLRVVVFVGTISYPLYLWHWPILSYLRIHLGLDISPFIRIVAIVASFILAWLTYRFVERPIRFGQFAREKTLGLCGAMVAMAVFAFAAVGVRQPDDRDAYVAFFDNHWPDYHYGHAHDLFARGREECNFLDYVNNTVRTEIAASCTTPTTAQSVLLWGDSYIQHLAPGLQSASRESISLLQIASSGCQPSIDLDLDHRLHCVRSNEFAIQTIARVRPDVVVLAQRSGHMRTDWEKLARDIREKGARSVLLVGPAPKRDRDLHLIIARRFWPNPPEWTTAGLIKDDLVADRELKQRYGQSADLTYVSLIDLLCRPEVGCRTYVGPDLLEDIEAHDSGHFTPNASRFVVENAILPALSPLLASGGAGRSRND